jgi:hypothetical protein
MATIIEQIGALDFDAIDDALGRVRVAVSADGELDLSGLDVGSLLGDVGPVVEAVRQLDGGGTDSVAVVARAALHELSDIATLPELEELGELVGGIEALAELIAELVDVLVTSDGSSIVDRLMTEVGGSLDLSGLVGDIAGRTADALRVQVPTPLVAAFERLARLASGSSSPDVLADALLGSLVGLDFAAVRALATDLSAGVDIVAGAGESTAIAGVFARVEAEVDAVVEATVHAPEGGADLDALVDALETLAASLDRTVAVDLPRFVEGFATDLRTARNRLTEGDPVAGLEDLLGQIPRPGIEPMEVLIQPLRDLAAGLDAVTSESMTEALQVAREELTAFVRVGELAALLDGIDDAQRRLVELIRRLPAEEVRDRLVRALRDVQREILSFQGFKFLEEAFAPVRRLSARLAELDTSALTDAMTEVVDSMSAVFADFPIDALRDAVDAVIEPLGAIVDEAGPVLTEITGQLEGLVAQVEAIDFDAAGAEVVEQLAGIRAQVTGALDTDSVPDALKAVIAGAASTLNHMDLAVELTDPFDDAIVRIDVDAFLAPITELWDDLRAALLRATPAALIDELDPPFEELLGRLDDVSLAPLTDALNGLFGELLDVLRRTDPRELLAPLDAEFDRIVDTVRAALDPAPLFAPVRAAYDAVHGELEAIDLEAAIQEMLGGISGAPKMLTEAVEGELRRGASGGDLPVPVPEERPFHFGDIVRPLAALVGEIRSRLHGLADDAAGEGLGLLADVTRELRRLLDPATGFAVRIADHLDARRGWFDAGAGGPYAALRTRIAGLDDALGRLELDAAARARVDGASGGVSLQARFELDVSVSNGASEAVVQTRRAAEPAGLGRSMRLLVRELDRLLPAPLVEDVIDPRAASAAFIDALMDPFDPAPLADELDAIGEQIMAKLAEFVDELSEGLLGIWEEMIAGLQPLMPTSVAARLQAVVDAITAEFAALDPVILEDEARGVVDATVGLLRLYSPARLAAELGGVFDQAIAIVEGLDPSELLGDLDPFAELRADLATLRPSEILAPLVTRAAVLTDALEVVASIDLDIVGELVARLEATFRVVLDGVEREWGALLDELEGIGGGSVSGSVSVGVG